MPTPVLVALTVVAASCVLSGLALLRLGRGRLTGALGAVAGAGALSGVVAAATGHPALTPALVLLSAHVALVALVAYPELSLSRPADVIGLTASLGTPVMLLGVVPQAGGQDPWQGPAASSALAVLAVLFLLTWWRLEHPVDHDRRALTWLALALGAAMVVAGLVAFVAPTVAGAVVALLVCAPVGPALYLGARRADVVDVRGLVVRLVVLTTTVITFVAAFSALAAVLEITSGGPPSVGALALAAGVFAAGFAPLQRALRGVVEELLFGRRPDLLGAASQVAGRLGEEPGAALDVIRAALVLPYVTLVVDGAEVAASGTPVDHLESLPLSLGSGREGALRVGLRTGDLDLTRDDRRVLGLVAPLLVQTLRARALVEGGAVVAGGGR
jgi:hypothetical protein